MFYNSEPRYSKERADAILSYYRPSPLEQIKKGLLQGQLETTHNLAADIALYGVTGYDKNISEEEYNQSYVNTPVKWDPNMTYDRAALLNRAAAEEMIHARFTKNLDMLGSSGAAYMLGYAFGNVVDLPNLISFGQTKVAISAASRYANIWKRVLPMGMRESATLTTKNSAANFLKRGVLKTNSSLTRKLGLLTEGAHVAGKLNLYSTLPALGLLSVKKNMYQQEQNIGFIFAELVTSYAFGAALGGITRGVTIGKRAVFGKKPLNQMGVKDLASFYQKRGILEDELKRPGSLLRRAIDDKLEKEGPGAIKDLTPNLLDPWRQGMTKAAVKTYMDIKRGKTPDVTMMFNDFQKAQEITPVEIPVGKKFEPDPPEPSFEKTFDDLINEPNKPKTATEKLEDFDQMSSELETRFGEMTPEVKAEFDAYRNNLKNAQEFEASFKKNMKSKYDEIITAATNCMKRNG